MTMDEIHELQHENHLLKLRVLTLEQELQKLNKDHQSLSDFVQNYTRTNNRTLSMALETMRKLMRGLGLKAD